VTEQEKLIVDPKATIDTYEPKNRIPDLLRALNKIDSPHEGKDGRKYIDLTDLNLTDKDVSFLSTKLVELKDKGGIYAINLSNNIMEHAPKSIFTMKHITKIDLSNNDLESLPKIEQKDGTIDHLTSLDIGSNSFDYFPEVTQFKNLQSLDIS
jgi:Leucine-rich repeat (LRR) protein